MKPLSFLLSLMLLMVLFLLAPSVAILPARAAGLWYVAPGGDDALNDCATPATPCASITGALTKPGFVAGDTVRVATGTFTKPPGPGFEVILLDKDAILSGGWNSAFSSQTGYSTIDVQGQSFLRRGITINTGVITTIERFIVQNGGGVDGAISNGGSLLLVNSAVKDGEQIGIYNTGTLTVISSSLSGNNFSGITNQSGAIMVMSDSTLMNNTYPSWGNIGAGILNQGTATLNNTTVSGNSSSDGGGGIGNYGTLTLNSVTITGNKSPRSGGIYNMGTATIRNSIVAGNTSSAAPDCMGSVIGSGGYNLIGNTNGFSPCYFSATTGDLLNTDAKLDSLQNNGGPTLTHALLLGSPAINAGNPAGCSGSTGTLTTDERGFARFGRCDIGAYELQPLGFSTKSINKSVANPTEPVTYNINLTNGGSTTLTGVQLTDTLPSQVAFINGSLSATGGSPSYSGGTIYWAGTLNAGSSVTINFGATPNPTLGYAVNSAVITGGGETFTRTASIQISGHLCNVTKLPSNPVLNVGTSGTWDNASAYDPVVLKEASTYKMWYTGRDAGNIRRIGYATSSDGITWTKYGSNPVLSPGAVWEGNRVSSPEVINDGGMYKMWYAGRASDGINRIGYATSPDGIVWTKYGSTVLENDHSGGWDSWGVTGPSVVKVGSTYHMWYQGSDGVTNRIGHATSTDGIRWTKDSANPVLNVNSPGSWDWIHVYAPNVMLYNGMFVMWYSGDSVPPASQIGYATSPDGSTWTRKEKLIPEGSAGAFDSNSADYASVIADGTGFKMWYSGMNSANTYMIGYTTIDVCGPFIPPGASRLYLPFIAKSPGSANCQAYYADDFGNSNSGWPVGSDSITDVGYVGGEYRISFKTPNYWDAVTSGAAGTDYIVSATARRVSGTGDYGIIFGIKEGFNQFYAFLIDPPWFSIRRYSGGTWMAVQPWSTSGYVTAGSNRLKVIRNGVGISAYSNDQLLASVSDGTITGWTRIGLIARGGSSLQDARFDDFAMYPVSCGSGAYAPTSGFRMSTPETKRGVYPQSEKR